MRMLQGLLTALALTLGANSGAAQQNQAQQNQMTFFVTSVGLGNGANLGGLAGADKYCQTLAAAAGAGNRRWRAYLSTQGRDAEGARDRIGAGPWANAKGVRIASNVAELHSPKVNLTKETALNEKGEVVNGAGDMPNRHDMLTGSQMSGTEFTDVTIGDRTCENWTSNGAGSAMVGHHDRRGLTDTEQAKSWNGSHPSKGCSQENLVGTGGAGLFYCFATN